MSKRNLNAYYYSFDHTGNEQIDSILEAVAKAGRNYHNTNQWDHSDPLINDGMTPAEHINIAAHHAAEFIEEVKSNE